MRHANLLEVKHKKFSQRTIIEDSKKCEDYLLNEEVSFEKRSMPFIPVPLMVKKQDYLSLKEKCERLYQILELVIEKYYEDKYIEDFFDLPQKYKKLLKYGRNSKMKNQIQFCRFDFGMSLNDIKFYEFNTASPAGMLFSYYFSEAFKQTELYKEILNDNIVFDVPLHKRNTFCQKLSKYRSDGIIVILNSKHNTLLNELHLFKRSFDELGIPAKVAYVEDLVFKDNHLYCDEDKVDVCLNKFFVDSLDDEAPFGNKWDYIQDYVEAVKNYSVSNVNNFSSSFIIESKTTMALLHDEKFKNYLSKEDEKLIEDIIPYTVKFSELNAQDVENIIIEKDSWVVKKVLATRGSSVFVGKIHSEQEFRKILNQIEKEKASEYIVQRFIEVDSNDVIENNIFNGGKQYIAMAGFQLEGEMVGLMTRTSSELVTNVGKSGAVQPTLVID